MSVFVSNKPSKNEQAIAMESYEPLLSVLEQLREEAPEIAIEETGRRIKIPLNALKLLAKILKATSEGKP
ncbi:MAG: excisionase, partial [Ekhidna sp.]|nr:excisionase [Ekhidna sp.]